MRVVTLPCGLAVGLRDATPEDESFIFSSWLVSFRENGDWPRRISKGRYFAEHKITVMKLLAVSSTLVACNPDKPGQILGYVVHQGRNILHWLYVKEPFRRDGLATRLLTEAQATDADCSHWTSAAAALGARLRYDPFLLEEF